MKGIAASSRGDDLILPRPDGTVESGSNLNRWFKQDVARLGLCGGRSVYAARACFISLAEGNGADRSALASITHPTPSEAIDLNRRLEKLCRAVECIRLPPVLLSPSDGEFTPGFTIAGTAKKTQYP